jgi:transglutaminase-like putative cysteine protease
MRLGITHETRYDYHPPVETAQHMAHLRPLNTATQKLITHNLNISPETAQQTETVDIFGNTRSFFSLQSAHAELRVVAKSVVETQPLPAPDLDEAASLPWEQVRERFRYRAGGSYDAACEFVFPSIYVPRHDDFQTYARGVFGTGMPLLQAVQALMERIHKDFEYDASSTQINTPAVVALAQRKGVCQDFAHIMIACLRGLGLPARYVSGYLLTTPPPGTERLVGSDASHAWVSVYSPDTDAGPGQWFDFDPTNNRSPGEDYVTLAIGRDFADVSPMRGVIHGGTNHTLHVAVTVEPLEIQ